MHSSVRHVVLTSAFVAIVLATYDARADEDAARRDFGEGVQLLRRGDYEGARRLFERAEAAHHASAIVYNLAVAEEHLAHPDAAVKGYARYLAEVGDSGDFSAAASTAIEQISRRSTRLRIDTKPPGARLFVDGVALVEPSPTAFLVPAGHHVVVAQSEDFRDEADVEANGTGDTMAVVIRAAKLEVHSRPEPPASPPSDRPEPHAAPSAPPAPASPNGFVWGTSFAFTPYHLSGAAKGQNQRAATQVMAGAVVDVGGAVGPRLELFARALFAVGPEAKPSEGAPFTYAVMGGPAASIHLAPWLWLGGAFIAGRLETVAHDAFYGTDLVFGAMGEVSVVVIEGSGGQYLLGAQPGVLLASPQDNSAFVFPITFGYRAY